MGPLRMLLSNANFVMAVLPSAADALRIFEELLAQGVVVRPLAAFGLPNCLRISTGLDDDNRRCIEALRKTYAASIGTTHAG